MLHSRYHQKRAAEEQLIQAQKMESVVATGGMPMTSTTCYRYYGNDRKCWLRP